jgi:hypothetical protein
MGGPETLSPQDEGESDIPDGELELGSKSNANIDVAYVESFVGNTETKLNVNFEGMDD